MTTIQKYIIFRTIAWCSVCLLGMYSSQVWHNPPNQFLGVTSAILLAMFIWQGIMWWENYQ